MRRLRLLPAMAGLAAFLLLPVGAAVAVPGTASAAGCNTVAAGSWANNCTVSEGSVSNLVLGVQQVIDGWGSCGEIALDGDFGSMTQAAVMCWQSAHGVANDGIVGPITWHAMQASLRKGPADGQWQYYSSYSNPAVNNFLQWTPSGVWYTRNNAGTFVRM
jgi:peptidoglycan hydrolase-like protein with peptidoglycan-binding domain